MVRVAYVYQVDRDGVISYRASYDSGEAGMCMVTLVAECPSYAEAALEATRRLIRSGTHYVYRIGKLYVVTPEVLGDGDAEACGQYDSYAEAAEARRGLEGGG